LRAKLFKSNDRKMKNRNMGIGTLKNALSEATISHNYFSVLHFSVITFFES
jgi:hypothetical protein